MPDSTKKQEVAELLMRTGKGHHKAFIKTNGFDPEWALWYSKQLEEPLPALLGVEMTRSRIIYELVRLEDTSDVSMAHWTQVYADDLVKRYIEAV